MPMAGRKIELDATTYVTRVNGKLVMIRKRPERICDVSSDSLEEGFGWDPRTKSYKDSETPSRKNTPPPVPIAEDVPNSPSPSIPNATSSAENPQIEAIMNSLPPNVPIYQKGNRQLALVPVNPRGGPSLPQNPGQQQGYQFPPFPPYQFPSFNPQPPPWMILGGYMCLPIDSNRVQAVSTLMPNHEAIPQPQAVPSSTPRNEALTQRQVIPSPIPNNEALPRAEAIPSSTLNNEVVPHTQPVSSSMSNTETSHQTSITIIRHVCGQCGRQRSPKYHQEHPIVPGELPVTAFCRKCCKDETSSAESNSSSRKLVGKHRDKNAKKMKKKPKRNYSTHILKLKRGDSDKESISPKKTTSFGRPEKSSSTNKTRAATTDNDTSVGGHRRRASYQGFGAQLQDVVGYLRGRERSSPLFDQKCRTSPSDSNRGYPIETAQNCKVSSRRAQTSDPILSKNNKTRKTYEYSPNSLSRPKTVQAKQELQVPRFSYEDYGSRQVIRDTQGSFEETTSEKSTSFSEQSARRRRIERSLSGEASPHATDNALRDRLLSEGNEVIVVTEHYVRRPKKASSFEEEAIIDPSQKQIDNGVPTRRQLSTESEALYYSDSHQSQQRRRDRQDYQLVRHNELSDDSSYSYESGLDSCDEDISSRSALPVGASARTLVQSQRRKSPRRQAGSGEVLLSDREKDDRGRSLLSAESNHRPPYVRDASDMGTERTAIPSPRPSGKHQSYSEDSSTSTRDLEQAERRVAFQGIEDGYISRGSQSNSARSLKEARTWYRNK